MIKIGMIGMNEGNGHPYSYSAIFNGYDPVELMKNCPFELIKEYLPRDHRNEVFINEAKVTHIWTQDIKISKEISAVALIPNIVKNIEDLVDKVDAVILARDDPWNHLEMARPFFNKKIPIFIDKQLTSSKKDYFQLIEIIGEDYPLMACSAIRYNKKIKEAKKNLNKNNVKSIHGAGRVSWMRYGHHLYEGIAVIWGTDVNWVRSLSEDNDHDIVQIKYKSGLNIILECVENLHLPIQFTCFSENEPIYTFPFDDYFCSFREMLYDFVEMIKTKKNPIVMQEILTIAKIILAGDISKKKNGIRICPKTLEAWSG